MAIKHCYGSQSKFDLKQTTQKYFRKTTTKSHDIDKELTGVAHGHSKGLSAATEILRYVGQFTRGRWWSRGRWRAHWRSNWYRSWRFFAECHRWRPLYTGQWSGFRVTPTTAGTGWFSLHFVLLSFPLATATRCATSCNDMKRIENVKHCKRNDVTSYYSDVPGCHCLRDIKFEHCWCDCSTQEQHGRRNLANQEVKLVSIHKRNRTSFLIRWQTSSMEFVWIICMF
jgi:hypothetical protein